MDEPTASVTTRRDLIRKGVLATVWVTPAIQAINMGIAHAGVEGSIVPPSTPSLPPTSSTSSPPAAGVLTELSFVHRSSGTSEESGEKVDITFGVCDSGSFSCPDSSKLERTVFAAEVGQSLSFAPPSDTRFQNVAAALTDGRNGSSTWHVFFDRGGGGVGSREADMLASRGTVAPPNGIDFAGHVVTDIRVVVDRFLVIPTNEPGTTLQLWELEMDARVLIVGHAAP